MFYPVELLGQSVAGYRTPLQRRKEPRSSEDMHAHSHGDFDFPPQILFPLSRRHRAYDSSANVSMYDHSFLKDVGVFGLDIAGLALTTVAGLHFAQADNSIMAGIAAGGLTKFGINVVSNHVVNKKHRLVY